MRIPRYWQRVRETVEIGGRSLAVTAWGFSDGSVADARRMAEERFPGVREAIAERRRRRSYDYLASPIREHRVQAWGPEGAEHLVITRNGYGALVLNAAGVMFIDIDVSPGYRFLIWGKSTQQKKEEAADRVEAAVGSGPLRAVRIYETAGGLRVVALDKTYPPDGSDTLRIMEGLGADPLYLRLCKAQKCFRARLSPKPWRIGLSRPPFRFPEDPDEPSYRDWVRQYERAAERYQTCRLLRTVGPDPVTGPIADTLRIHDDHCGVAGAAQLA